ncbi:MAG: hypothetical protein AB1659_09990 [Thermodesulfobacteriota bacterium]
MVLADIKMPDMGGLELLELIKKNLLRMLNKSFISGLLSANGGNVTQVAKICGFERWPFNRS